VGIRPKADEARPITRPSDLSTQCLLAISHYAKSTFQDAYQLQLILPAQHPLLPSPGFTWTPTQRMIP
jgi:hypothetical protein